MHLQASHTGSPRGHRALSTVLPSARRADVLQANCGLYIISVLLSKHEAQLGCTQTCRNKGLFSRIPKDSPRNFLLKEFLFHCPIKTIKTGEGARVTQKWLNTEARQGRGIGYPESTHTLSPGSPAMGETLRKSHSVPVNIMLMIVKKNRYLRVVLNTTTEKMIKSGP